MPRVSNNKFYFILRAFKLAYRDNPEYIYEWDKYNIAVKKHLKSIKRR